MSSKFKALSAIFFCLLMGQMQWASATFNTDVDRLLNWAEIEYDQFFSPPNASTTSYEQWLYRYYPEKGNYLGVHIDTHDVYVLGHLSNGEIQRVGPLQEYLELIDNSEDNNAQATENCVHLSGQLQVTQMSYSTTTTTPSRVVDAVVETTINELTHEYMNVNTVTTTTINGVEVVLESNGEFYFHIDGNYYMSDSVSMENTAYAFGSVVESTTVLTHYTPAKIDGVVNQVCANASRESGVIEQSITTNGELETLQIPITNYTVESVSEVVNTPAGQFTTIKFVSTSATKTIIEWIAIETEITVKSEVYEDDLLVSSMLLTSFE